MADSKISALPASTVPLTGTEVLPIVQSSTTKQVSVANLTAGRAISATQITLTTGSLIVASGQGVDFSATPGTGTSELLADYEEGTWTPTQGGGLTVIGSFSSEGTYTIIGRTVVLRGKVTGSTSVAVTANTVLCGGLPVNSNVNYSIGSVTNANLSATGAVLATGATIYSSAIAATTDIYFTVTYYV